MTVATPFRQFKLECRSVVMNELLDTVIDEVRELAIRIQLILLDERIRQLELIQQGTEVIESLFGYQIGD